MEKIEIAWANRYLKDVWRSDNPYSWHQLLKTNPVSAMIDKKTKIGRKFLFPSSVVTAMQGPSINYLTYTFSILIPLFPHKNLLWHYQDKLWSKSIWSRICISCVVVSIKLADLWTIFHLNKSFDLIIPMPLNRNLIKSLCILYWLLKLTTCQSKVGLNKLMICMFTYGQNFLEICLVMFFVHIHMSPICCNKK